MKCKYIILGLARIFPFKQKKKNKKYKLFLNKLVFKNIFKIELPIIYNAVCCFIIRCFVLAFAYHIFLTLGDGYLVCVCYVVLFQGFALLIPCFNYHLINEHIFAHQEN